MKKQVYKLGLVAFLGLSAMTFAQVGINEDAPKATLDVTAKTTTGDALEGILIPEVSTQKAEDMGANSQIQESTLVYIKNPSAASSNTYTAEVKTKGFYYFDGTWKKVGGGNSVNSAVYRNVRTDNGTSIDISDTDFFIHLTNQAGGTINVPDASTSQGRELCFFNSGSDGFATGAEGNGASVQPSAGTCIISVDGVWVTKNSY